MFTNIYIHKTSQDAKIPDVAYNGTSAAFDLYSTESVTINPGEAKVVPNGLNIAIDQNSPYYMLILDRSSMGFKKDLSVYQGLVDAGYTGDFGVKMYNVGKTPVTIEKGDKYAQVLVLPKVQHEFIELNDEEFEEFKAKQERGDSGFGSSGK